MKTWNWMFARAGIKMAPAADGGDPGEGGTDYGDELPPEGGEGEGGEGEGGEGEGGEGEGGEGEGGEGEGGEGEGGGGEGEGEGEGEGGEGEKPKHFVPKSRYDAAQARARQERDQRIALEKQLAERDGTAAPAAGTVDALEAQLIDLDNKLDDAIADNKRDDIKTYRQQIRSIERQITDARISESAARATNAALSGTRFETQLGQYESMYPAINPDAEEYDADLDDEVSVMMDAYVAAGLSHEEALAKAIGYVVEPRFTAATTTPASKAEAKKTDVKKNVATSKQQPGKMAAGQDNGTAGMTTKINIMSLSDAEFDKLTPEQLEDLRGDHV